MSASPTLIVRMISASASSAQSKISTALRKSSAEADAIMSTGFSTLAVGDKNSLNRRFV